MAEVVTAADIQWSDGSNFQGTLLLFFVTPELGAGNYPTLKARYTAEHLDFPPPLPQRIAIPISNGVLQKNKILKQVELSPPNVKLYDFWLDSHGVVVANGAALFTITTDTHTITVPTLTVPTAETSLPSISYTVSGVTLTFSGVEHTFENLSGTKNGSNQAFTISRVPVGFMVIFSGAH